MIDEEDALDVKTMNDGDHDYRMSVAEMPRSRQT